MKYIFTAKAYVELKKANRCICCGLRIPRPRLICVWCGFLLEFALEYPRRARTDPFWRHGNDPAALFLHVERKF